MAQSDEAKRVANRMHRVFRFDHFVRNADLRLCDMKQEQRMSGNGHHEFL